MYDIIKSVLNSHRYELNDMLGKIDTIWIQGDLSDEQRTELVDLARANADPAQSYAPLQEQIDQAFAAIKVLERKVAALESGTPEEPAPEPEEWPEWIQPSGVHDAYNMGDQVTFNGKKYRSKLGGNVWSPAAYPDGWEEVA